MKLKNDIEVDWGNKKVTLKAGVDYKNLPKEVTAQLPKPASRKGKKSD